jgi:hypothetical protein
MMRWFGRWVDQSIPAFRTIEKDGSEHVLVGNEVRLMGAITCFADVPLTQRLGGTRFE